VWLTTEADDQSSLHCVIVSTYQTYLQHVQHRRNLPSKSGGSLPFLKKKGPIAIADGGERASCSLSKNPIPALALGRDRAFLLKEGKGAPTFTRKVTPMLNVL